jgi:formylglycine-generating enzyme required for sulfatase activity
LDKQGRPNGAFRMLRGAQANAPDDPRINDLLSDWTTPVSIGSSPPGAQVYIRDFVDSVAPPELIGSTPLERVRLPLGTFAWTVSRPGFKSQELLGSTLGPALRFSLRPSAEVPPGMVHVEGGTLPERLFEIYSIRPVKLDDYWIDEYEVTNQQFKKFLDQGGYETSTYWPSAYFKAGSTVGPAEERNVFRDRTGRPGPATWEVGTYPDGQEDYPVGGVSWYEAAAYCASVGKQLPTVYHWYNAADLGMAGEFVRFSNLGTGGPVKVGHRMRLGGHGTYDMAGNVKEWVWNKADAGHRYILGGGWDEPSYMFRDYDAQRPSDRKPNYGIRCAKYVTPDSTALMRAVEVTPRDYRHEPPVPDEVFAGYRSLYRYDRTPLEASVDSTDNRSQHWSVEWVSFAAAYDKERVPALLYLPKNTHPPYQTVVYYPGAGAFYAGQPVASALEAEGAWFLFLVRSGRAVLLPVYKGAYERNVPGMFERPHVWRDVIVQTSKDIGRAIDYVETRRDIDAKSLAYLGVSMGAAVGPIMTAVEPRFKASILVGGGLYYWHRPPESEAINFLPRVKVPTLMINGRYDFFFSLKHSQGLMFDLLGVPAADKSHRIFESGHIPSERQEMIKEMLAWLDRYLGPVGTR